MTAEGEEPDYVNVPTVKPKKVKSSSFHVTINTNQRYGSKDAIVQDMRPLYTNLLSIFNDTEKVREIIEIMDVNKKVRGGEYILRDNMEFDETPSCKCECKIGDMSEFFFS